MCHLRRFRILIIQLVFSTHLAIVLDPDIVVYGIPNVALVVQRHCGLPSFCKSCLCHLIPHTLLFFVDRCCYLLLLWTVTFLLTSKSWFVNLYCVCVDTSSDDDREMTVGEATVLLNL